MSPKDDGLLEGLLIVRSCFLLPSGLPWFSSFPLTSGVHHKCFLEKKSSFEKAKACIVKQLYAFRAEVLRKIKRTTNYCKGLLAMLAFGSGRGSARVRRHLPLPGRSQLLEISKIFHTALQTRWLPGALLCCKLPVAHPPAVSQSSSIPLREPAAAKNERASKRACPEHPPHLCEEMIPEDQGVFILWALILFLLRFSICRNVLGQPRFLRVSVLLCQRASWRCSWEH